MELKRKATEVALVPVSKKSRNELMIYGEGAIGDGSVSVGF